MILYRSPTLLQVAGATVLAWLAVCNSSAAETSPTTVVVAKDFMFSPTTVTVAAGSTVTWSNRDDEAHTVVSDTGLFRSGAIDTNENFSYKFDKPGTYHFVCSLHPQMVGTVVVQ